MCFLTIVDVTKDIQKPYHLKYIKCIFDLEIINKVDETHDEPYSPFHILVYCLFKNRSHKWCKESGKKMDSEKYNQL